MDSDAALPELRDRLSIALMPLKNWHGQPQTAPVLWRDADSEWADAVLSEGEVAVLSGPEGLARAIWPCPGRWPLPGKRQAVMARIAACAFAAGRWRS